MVRIWVETLFKRVKWPVALPAAHLAGHLIGLACLLQLRGCHVTVERGHKVFGIFAILQLQMHTDDKH